MVKRLTIGQLSKLTGVPARTIRYYEEADILPVPQRTESSYRLYSEADMRRLELVRRARLLDMALLEVRELVRQANSATCSDFQSRFLEVVRLKLQDVDKRITDLQHLKVDLQRLEAHLTEARKEEAADHTMLECSPDTCTCLGEASRDKGQLREVTLWLDQSELKR